MHVSYLRSGHIIFQERDRAMRMLIENMAKMIEPALPVVSEGKVYSTKIKYFFSLFRFSLTTFFFIFCFFLFVFFLLF